MCNSKRHWRKPRGKTPTRAVTTTTSTPIWRVVHSVQNLRNSSPTPTPSTQVTAVWQTHSKLPMPTPTTTATSFGSTRERRYLSAVSAVVQAPPTVNTCGPRTEAMLSLRSQARAVMLTIFAPRKRNSTPPVEAKTLTKLRKLPQTSSRKTEVPVTAIPPTAQTHCATRREVSSTLQRATVEQRREFCFTCKHVGAISTIWNLWTEPAAAKQ